MRPLGVKVQVDGDPVAIGERVVRPLLSRAALARELRVDDIELVGDAFEALGLGVPTRLGCAPRPAGRVACECRRRRPRPRLPLRPRRRTPQAAASSARRSSPPGAATKIAAGPSASTRCDSVRVARTSRRVRELPAESRDESRAASCAEAWPSSPAAAPGARAAPSSSRAPRPRARRRRAPPWGSAGTARGRPRAGRSGSRRRSARRRPPRSRPTSRAARPPASGGGRGGSAGRGRSGGRPRRTSPRSGSRSMVSARYERLGSPGSKPWTTSKSPRASARRRFARTATGTPRCVRRESGIDGPTAMTVGVVAALQGPPPGQEIARARRRSQDGHLVAAPAQRFRGSRRRGCSPRAAATRRTA